MNNKGMKKILKFLSLMLVVVLTGFSMTSCSDDDDEAVNALVGTWQGDYKDGTHYTWTFNNDGTGAQIDDDGSQNFKYSYTGDRLIISYNGGGAVAYTVSITGKTAMFTVENTTTFYTLTRL